VNEGVRQAGEWALLDHLALQHDFPEKLPDPRPQWRYLEIRRGARTADHLQDLAEAPPEQGQGGEKNSGEYRPFQPRCVGHMKSVLNVTCGATSLGWNGVDGESFRIVVSGAAGFVGSYMCDRLLAEGHSVVAPDNLSTGAHANLAHLAGHPGFFFVAPDITTRFTVEGAGDCVVNMASPASPKDYLEHPIETSTSAPSAPAACWNWRSTRRRAFCRPPPANAMAIRWCIRRWRRIGAT